MQLIDLKPVVPHCLATIPVCRFFPGDAPDSWTLQDATALVKIVPGAAMAGTALGYIRTPIRAVLCLSDSGEWELIEARPVTIRTAAEALHGLTASAAVREWAGCVLHSLLFEVEAIPPGPLNEFVRDVLSDGRLRDLFTNLSSTYESNYPKQGGLLAQAAAEMWMSGQLAKLRTFSRHEAKVCEVGGLFQALAYKIPGIDVLEENLAVLKKHDPWAASELGACFAHSAQGHFAYLVSTSPVARVVSLSSLCARLPWGPFDEDDNRAGPVSATDKPVDAESSTFASNAL